MPNDANKTHLKLTSKLVYLQSVINSRMDINVIVTLTRFPTLLLLLPPHVLLMIRQRHIEIERLVPLREPQPDERVLPTPVVDPEHKIPRRLHGVLSPPGIHEASREQIAGVRILEADLASVLARHDAEPAGPDLIGLEPFAAFVSAGCGSRRDLVDGDLAHHEECVLECLVSFSSSSNDIL
ncbi:hypothetical protein F2Q68_00038231 [Brassica cretica]|uniref:Uncharacterized protein n=1 Tax=Brassica cretica TaxID=69181 RepID=A0A8S9MUW6_BRACR|nr:hypothetical protein F2Q68_00038231 [Brassica cretica]